MAFDINKEYSRFLRVTGGAPVAPRPTSTPLIDMDYLREKIEREELAKVYNLPVQEKPKTTFQKIGDIFTSKENVNQSVYGVLTTQYPDRLKELDKSIAKKRLSKNKLRRIAARWSSAVPIVGPTISEKLLDRSEVDFTDLELSRMKDPLSPNYDPLLKGINIGWGQSIGVRDVEDMGLMLARFAGLGKITKGAVKFVASNFGKGKKMNAVLENIDEATAMGVTAKGIKIRRIGKTALDFNIDSLSNLYPELSQEGIALEDKINAIASTLPRATIEASLFGYLGGVKNVIGQYGGMFAAGYGSALHGGSDHHEAFKHGILLTGMHFTNVLGVSGKQKLKQWGAEKKIDPTLIEKEAKKLVNENYIKNQDIYVVKDPDKYGLSHIIKDDLKPDTSSEGRFQILKKTGKNIRKEGVLVVKDLRTGKNVSLKGNQAANLLKNLTYESTPVQYESVEKALRAENQKLIRDLGHQDTTTVEKRELGQNFIQKIRRRVLGYSKKFLGVEKLKEGEIPYWYNLNQFSKEQIIRHGKQYGWKVELPLDGTKADVIRTVEALVPRQKGKRLSSTDMTVEQLIKERNIWRYEIAKKSVREQINNKLYTWKVDDTGKVKARHDKENILVSTTKFVKRKLSGDIEADYNAKDIAKKAVEHLKGLGLKDADHHWVIKAAAGEKKALEKVKTSKELTRALEYYRDEFAAFGEWGQSKGVLKTLMDNYWNGIYKETSSEIRRKSIAWNESSQGKAYYKNLGVNPKSDKALEKTISTPSLAEKAGLTPVYNIPFHMGKWWQSVGKAANAKAFINSIKNMPAFPDGSPLLSSVQRKGYIKIDSPELSEIYAGNRNKSVYAQPDIATELSYLYSAWRPKDPTYSAMYNRYQKLRGGFKRFIMMNPVIHGWNIYSDAFDEVWLSSWNNALPLIKTARLTGFTPIPFVRAPEYGAKIPIFDPTGARGKAKLEKLYKQWGFDGTAEGVRGLMAKYGVNTEGHGIDMETHFSKLMPDLKLNEGVTANKFSLANLRDKSDELLWGRIVGGAQEAVFAMKYATMLNTRKGTGPLKKGKGEKFTKDEAGEMAAHYVNDLFGTIGKETFTPSEGALLNSVFFARNWTISNLRLLTGAGGVRSENYKFLSHRGLTKEEMSALQGEYQKHLIKGVTGLVLTTNILNYMATGTEGFSKEFDESKAKLSFQNPEGHKLDMAYGQKDNRGREIYVVPPLFRYIRDYFSWYGEPNKTFFNKLEPMSKNFLEQLMNHSQWSNQPIAKEEGIDGIKARFKYSFEGLTPWGQYAPGAREFGYQLTGEEHLQSKKMVQLFTPFLGTWVRHGASGGREGELVNEYLRELGIQRDEVDIYIDEMIMSGDIAGAVQEMIGKKRYRTMDGIRDRIRKFKNPFHYKYTTLLNRKSGERSKIHFANWIRMRHPEDFEQFKERLKRGISG